MKNDVEKIFSVICFFAFICLNTFAQSPNELVAKYNEFLDKKDFSNALQVIANLLSKEPGNLIYHREYAKMLAATGREQEFLTEIRAIRNSNLPNSIDAIWETVGHKFVPPSTRNIAKNLFKMLGDTTVLQGWPKDEDQKLQETGKVIAMGNSKSQSVPTGKNLQPKASPSRVKVTLKSGETYIFEKTEVVNNRYIGYLQPNNQGKVELSTSNIKNISNAPPPPAPAPGPAGMDPYQFEMIRNVLLFFGAVMAIYFILRVIAIRCPKCGSFEYSTLKAQELDRFIGDKKIDIRNSKGEKINEQHVSVTYVKVKMTYQCSSCKEKFYGIEKRELT